MTKQWRKVSNKSDGINKIDRVNESNKVHKATQQVWLQAYKSALLYSNI